MSNAEDLANWYLRLNGFLTIPNFVLHPSRRGSQRTDADVFGVRFPFRKEFPDGDFDDAKLKCSATKPSMFIVEVKTKEIDVNEAWQNPDKSNINKVLIDLGFFGSDAEIDATAQGLYDCGRHDGETYYCSLLFVGNVDTDKIPDWYLSVPRVLWMDIIKFIHGRFSKYVRIKAQHDQWDEFGKRLYQFAIEHASLTDFEVKVRHYCLLPAA